jgi:hypothetical protein
MPRHENKSEIIEPDASIYVTLDDISQKLSKLLKTQAEVLKTASRDQKLLSSILKELKDDADEGEYYRQEAVANPITFNIIDFLAILGFPVRGYMIKNAGVNTILYGHNITDLSIDTNIDTGSARFNTLLANDEDKFTYNRKRIKNIYIKSVGGNSAYKLRAVW